MLGKIRVDCFPAIFGPDGDLPLDLETVQSKFSKLAERVSATQGKAVGAEEVAEGFLRIAVENMANAIKKISVQRGYDVTEYTLNCFGGAGGQHACLVADALGMTSIFLHPFAGVLSAYGMGLAEIRALRETQLGFDFAAADLESQLAEQCDPLAASARREVRDQGIGEGNISVVTKVHLRYEGTDTNLLVNAGPRAQMQQEFEQAHRQRFGFIARQRGLVVEAASVEAIGVTEAAIDPETPAPPAEDTPVKRGLVRMYGSGEWRDATLYDRSDLHPGQRVVGPAIIIEPTATIVLEPRLARRPQPPRPPAAGALRRAGEDRSGGHHCRPGDAGGVQQPVHVHRRADGRHPAEHRLLGEHQGAAGLLLRPVRRQGQSRRQRPPCARPLGFDGGVRKIHHQRQPRPHQAG